MRVIRNICVILVTIMLGFSSLAAVRVQASEGSMKDFLDSTVHGLRIQANATEEARPGDNITVVLVLTALTKVDVEYFNLSIFGFLNGTYSTLMTPTLHDAEFSFNSSSRWYNLTFVVPAWVSGKTYGEIKLSHNATYSETWGQVTVDNRDFVCGFYMTDVQNVYLKGLEQKYQQLGQNYSELQQNLTDALQGNAQLGQNYSELQQNFAQLQQNLTQALQGNANQLDSARTVITVLIITTVFFVATTLYFVLRKQAREYW
jgi:hypothetical protein